LGSFVECAWITEIDNQSDRDVVVKNTVHWARNITFFGGNRHENWGNSFTVPAKTSVNTEHMYVGWQSANEAIFITPQVEPQKQWKIQEISTIYPKGSGIATQRGGSGWETYRYIEAVLDGTVQSWERIYADSDTFKITISPDYTVRIFKK
jgi:hypothetical protein